MSVWSSTILVPKQTIFLGHESSTAQAPFAGERELERVSIHMKGGKGVNLEGFGEYLCDVLFGEDTHAKGDKVVSDLPAAVAF